MTQKDQVIEVMRNSGGYATLKQLYELVDYSRWKTHTPEHSIRKIVQKSDEFFRVKKGVWALKECKESVLKRFATEGDVDNGVVSMSSNHQAVVVERDSEYFYNMTTHTGINKVFYGTPGCGKSFYVEDKVIKKQEGIVDEDNIIRTVFYPDYTNTDFVGQLIPSRIDKEKVAYEFAPGPFTRALLCAIKKPNEKVALVIEELNRGNAPSIFGDIFQLLDRDNGKSRYSIVNKPITDYLKRETQGYFNLDTIKIPGNLFIFATMNTCDQNVFTLDTAFKRRWDFVKLSNKFDDSESYDLKLGDMLVPCLSKIRWRQFVDGVNMHIITNVNALSAEDKQIGKYFVNEDMLLDENEKYTKEKALRFAYKVFEYIWSDVAKYNRDKWFVSGIKSFDDVIERVNRKDEDIFVPELMGTINPNTSM